MIYSYYIFYIFMIYFTTLHFICSMYTIDININTRVNFKKFFLFYLIEIYFSSYLQNFYQGNIFTLRSATDFSSTSSASTSSASSSAYKSHLRTSSATATESISLELIDNKFKILQEKSNFAESFEIHSGNNLTENQTYYLAIRYVFL